MFPDGIVWVRSAGLPGADSLRDAEVPFAFAVGRVASPGGERAASELDAAAEAVCSAAAEADLAAVLPEYALYVAERCPSVMARLRGEAAAAFVASRPGGSL
jgi:hypothetical protein